MGLNIQSDAAKEVDNFACITIIGRLAGTEEEQFITKVEYLRRGLVERYNHGFPLRDRVTLQRRHQAEGGVRIQAGRWFLKQAYFGLQETNNGNTEYVSQSFYNIYNHIRAPRKMTNY